MDLEKISFPLYRKYKNNKSYFKIISPVQFEEVQIVGSRRFLRHTEALLYPEKMFIMDMIFDYAAMADAITEQEYLGIRP